MLEPLALVLEFTRADYAGDPYAFRLTQQKYLLRSGGGGFASVELNWDEALLSDLEAVRRPGRDPVALQRLGETLRRFLQPAGWLQQESRILEAVHAQRQVALTLRSAAAELYALPWELITIKSTGQHVGELPGVLLKYEWPETTTFPERRELQAKPGRIGVCWSAAGGSVPAAEQIRAIQQACKAGGHAFDETRDVLPHVSLSRLAEFLDAALRRGEPVTVLHLLCHGGAVGPVFGLQLDGEQQGKSVIVDAGRLRQVLAPYVGMIRVVVLVACDGGNSGTLGNQLGSVAQALHRAGLSKVVASRYPLSVTGANRLTEVLYYVLCHGTVEDAILAARQHLARDAEHIDWASLQLYSRTADDSPDRQNFLGSRRAASGSTFPVWVTLPPSRLEPVKPSAGKPDGASANLAGAPAAQDALLRTVDLPKALALYLAARELRRLIAQYLPNDSDLSAFLIDYLPQIKKRFSPGMERVAVVNLLLELVELSVLTANLRRAIPSAFAHILVVESGVDAGRLYPLACPGRFTIGRALDADVIMPDEPGISRKHVTLRVSATGVSAYRGGSLPFSVNGQPTGATCVVATGDRIQVKNTVFRLETTSRAEERTDKPKVDSQVAVAAVSAPQERSYDWTTPSHLPAAERESSLELLTRGSTYRLFWGLSDKILAMGRIEEAERMMRSPMMDMLTRAEAAEIPDSPLIAEALSRALRLAIATKKAEWFAWIFDYARLCQFKIHKSLSEEIFAAITLRRPVIHRQIAAYVKALADQETAERLFTTLGLTQQK